MQQDGISRRSFVGAAGIAAAAWSTAPLAAQDAQPPVQPESEAGEPVEEQRTVTIGVMGLSRGSALATGFAGLGGVKVAYLCDVDVSRAEACARRIRQSPDQTPEIVTDFRRILDDPNVDALICAAPNHWHGPATIMACQAGKHVYVEKPCSHNPQEGEWMIEVARKRQRAVQMGTQRRSGPGMIEAMGKLRDGAIGKLHLARSWYNNVRGSMGKGMPSDPPPGLDYELWQGPAPRQPYQANVVHYNWHWRWHWGNGELGNNGVHTLDICRWGMDVSFPKRVTSSGGRYFFDDDQQTPDTHTVCFEFDDNKMITWTGLSCNRHGGGFVSFYGADGAMDVTSDGKYTIYDRNDKVVETGGGGNLGEREHLQNFVTAIRGNQPLALNAEIEIGHRSTLLCHLGNIAHRTGRTLTCDPENGHVMGDEEAQAYWRRDYAPGWEPQVS